MSDCVNGSLVQRMVARMGSSGTYAVSVEKYTGDVTISDNTTGDSWQIRGSEYGKYVDGTWTPEWNDSTKWPEDKVPDINPPMPFEPLTWPTAKPVICPEVENVDITPVPEVKPVEPKKGGRKPREEPDEDELVVQGRRLHEMSDEELEALLWDARHSVKERRQVLDELKLRAMQAGMELAMKMLRRKE